MIQFALPWMLGAGVLAAAFITSLHFLSVQRPPELLLPTARFLDEGTVRAVSPTSRPTDLLLLALRVLALLLAAVALAGPTWVPGARRVLTLVVADGRLRTDSARLLRDAGVTPAAGDARMVWSDSLSQAGGDTTAVETGLRADVAAALPLAMRVASAVAVSKPDVDSFALVVLVPDGATVSAAGWRAWRSAWPGAVRVVMPVVSRDAATRRRSVRYDSADADDIVNAAIASRVGAARTRGDAAAGAPSVVREIAVFRSSLGEVEPRDGPDSGLADGALRLVWPANGRPPGWDAASDSGGAVVARGVALVTTLRRTARATPAVLRASRPIAWWSDGAVAAVERRRGGGCEREVAIPVPAASDVLLATSADGLMSALLAPCAGDRYAGASVPPFIALDSLDASRGAAAPAARFRGTAAAHTTASPAWLAPALLALAVLLLVLEWVLRDRNDVVGGPRPRVAGGVSA